MTSNLIIYKIKKSQVKILDTFLDFCKQNNKPTTKAEILDFMNKANEIFVNNIKNEYIIEKLYTK